MKKAMVSQPMTGKTEEEIIATRMNTCHVAYFAKGREHTRGCRLEHEVAKAYNVEIMYES